MSHLFAFIPTISVSTRAVNADRIVSFNKKKDVKYQQRKRPSKKVRQISGSLELWRSGQKRLGLHNAYGRR